MCFVYIIRNFDAVTKKFNVNLDFWKLCPVVVDVLIIRNFINAFNVAILSGKFEEKVRHKLFL